MDRKSHQSLADKVKKMQELENENYSKQREETYQKRQEKIKAEEAQAKQQQTNKKTKEKTPFPKSFEEFKQHPTVQKIWLTFFSSKHIEDKKLRYLDRFMKVSFNFGVFTFLLFFIIIITSPNQFTKELIYRKNDTVVLDSKGTQIGKISQKREQGENVLNVEYKDLTQSLINSTIATEDATFFRHNGVDYLNTAQNGFKTLVLRSSSAGGSTITQQIIGQTHVGRIGNSSVLRKIREIFLSHIAETQLSKERIIESYLNYFEFGQGNIRGVELASNWFYDQNVHENDYVQSSILVGTLNAPLYSNPLGGKNPETKEYHNGSQDRLETVLLSNYNQGYLQDEEYFLLQQVQVADVVDFNKKTDSNPYQAYIDVVAKELQDTYDVDPFVETLEVKTNMDRSAQKYANQLTKQQHVYVPDSDLNFGFVVSKTQTGEIVALSGGKQYRKNGAYLFNNAVDNKQQPGSAFKPIIDYSPTFEYLHWSDRTPISNAPYKYPNTGQEVYNHDRASGGILTMDAAIANSRNLTALRAMEAVYDEVGFDELTNYLNRFGFDFSSDEVVPAYGLGALEFGVTPVQMNAAYATFGNGGKYIKPYTIKSFKRENGNEVKAEVEEEQIIDEKTAFMMSTALERSTKVSGAYVNTAGYVSSPYAAKTGTSNWDESGQQYGIPDLAPKDTWFAGYTTEYTMSSWGGYDTKEIKKGKYPGYGDGSHDYSAKLWGAMMNKISNGKEESYLEMDLPDGIIEANFNSAVEPPFKLGSTPAYFYEDNAPKGYSTTSEFEQDEDDDEDYNNDSRDNNSNQNRNPQQSDEDDYEDDDYEIPDDNEDNGDEDEDLDDEVGANNSGFNLISYFFNFVNSIKF